MKRILLAAAALAAGCEPPDRTASHFNAENLKEIHRWDPIRGAAGHYAYDAMLGDEPKNSVPVLIAKLGDRTPTAINDIFHEPPTVGHVAFHILLRIFAMHAAEFERHGIWIMENDPSRNPIYQVKFKDESTRQMLAVRFRELGVKRGWLKAP